MDELSTDRLIELPTPEAKDDVVSSKPDLNVVPGSSSSERQDMLALEKDLVTERKEALRQQKDFLDRYDKLREEYDQLDRRFREDRASKDDLLKRITRLEVQLEVSSERQELQTDDLKKELRKSQRNLIKGQAELEKYAAELHHRGAIIQQQKVHITNTAISNKTVLL